MPYNQNILQASDKLKDSQPQLLGNFQAIKTLIDVNHVTFDDPSGNQGKHHKVSFPVQSPAPTFAAGEQGLYNLNYNNNLNTQNELFVHKLVNGGTGTSDIPFTASIMSQGAVSQNMVGWTYLPSGILLRWWHQGLSNGVNIITLPGNASAFNTIFTVIVCPWSTSTVDPVVPVRLINIVNNTRFDVFAGGTGGSMRALVIGN